ncbi:hypothetical protein SRHO_G00071000 [Serrasalmus rhombeus]
MVGLWDTRAFSVEFSVTVWITSHEFKSRARVRLPAQRCEIDAVLELGAKHLTWGCGILFTFPVVWSTLGVIEMCGTDMCGL